VAYSKNPETRFFIGAIEIDAATGIAWADGAVLPLGKKVVATLAALCAQLGEVVPKAALLEASWTGSSVDDSSLWQNVHVLRGVLARYAPSAKIETVKGRGYCLKLTAVSATLAHPVSTQAAVPARRQVVLHWFWPAAAALLCVVVLDGIFEHRAPTRRTIILITTNDAAKLPPLPPLPASE
jgi:DNA-binding winged helix-turn-helix (wHTH) protein